MRVNPPKLLGSPLIPHRQQIKHNCFSRADEKNVMSSDSFSAEFILDLPKFDYRKTKNNLFSKELHASCPDA